MCGISGFYNNTKLTFDYAIEKMNASISHRGSDSSGVWHDKNSGIVLGHQRLSILDLSAAGTQPMQSNSGRFVLTYNGEIYNHVEIRKHLVKINSKINWRGSSDTETLLESIEVLGIEKTIQKIKGMFAFGIWDKKKRILTLARDRMGEKPLYFGWQGEGINKIFLFGSELKALKAHPQFEGKINRDAIALQLRHNYIPDPYSIYKDIYKLLPGHYLQLNEEHLKKKIPLSLKSYWSSTKNAIYGNQNQLTLSIEDMQRDLEKQLRSSVKHQMISDVPLGAFLSGGIDSSLVVALMQSESSSPIKTFTIGFTENDYNEAIYAKKIALHLGTDHSELYVSPKEIMEVIPKLPLIYDEPFSDSSQIPTYLVSQLAKQQVKVALSGDGGDELFCGYNRYMRSDKIWNLLCLIPHPLRKILASGIEYISPQNWTEILDFLPFSKGYVNLQNKIYKGAKALNARTVSELYYVLSSHWQNPTEIVLNSKEPSTFLTEFKPELKSLSNHQQMMALDLITYLPNDNLVKVDRAAMASSLETRVPFLDHKLIEYIWKIPHSFKFRNGQGKWILKKILNQYVPKNLTERPKMGFAIPLNSWLRGPLREWAENLLNEKRLVEEGYLNSKLIRDKWKEHLSGKKNWKSDLWNVLMFQAWIEKNN